MSNDDIFINYKSQVSKTMRTYSRNFMIAEKDAYKNLLDLNLKFPSAVREIHYLKSWVESAENIWTSKITARIDELNQLFENTPYPVQTESLSSIKPIVESLEIDIQHVIMALKGISIRTNLKIDFSKDLDPNMDVEDLLNSL